MNFYLLEFNVINHIHFQKNVVDQFIYELAWGVFYQNVWLKGDVFIQHIHVSSSHKSAISCYNHNNPVVAHYNNLVWYFNFEIWWH